MIYQATYGWLASDLAKLWLAANVMLAAFNIHPQGQTVDRPGEMGTYTYIYLIVHC